MFATFINVGAVLFGGGFGLLLKGKTSPKITENITRALGLCVCIIGISGALCGDLMMLVVSIALGTLTGELLNIDGNLNKFGEYLQKRFSKSAKHNTPENITNPLQNNFAKGFVTASLMFCVGAMSVNGSVDAGLRHEYSTIFTKSILDGVSSLIFSSMYGVGVLFSVFVILIYQGSIETVSSFLGNVFPDDLIIQISAAGSVMIFAIGLNMAAKTDIKTANLLPGLIFAGLYYAIILR